MKGLQFELFKLFVRGTVALYRATGGRIGGVMNGRKVILLTTIGNKTGKQRTVPVVPFLDGAEVYVMASMAGAPQNPAWYANLRAKPEVGVQLGAETWRARATSLEGAARDELWKRIVQAMPDFGKYQEKTSRVIPVVKLEKIQPN